MAIDWYYPRPELAKSYLEEFSRRGARALTVFAERGLGKTAFLQTDLTPEAVARGRLPVCVDVWAVRTQPESARLRDEQLIYQAARGTYRVNNSVLANQLRESTPQMADPKAVALPPLALGAAVRPIAAAPGHSYVGHVLEVSDQMVVQNSGGTFIRHDLANLIAGKYELLKPGNSVKIEYTDALWKVAAAPGPQGT